MNNQEIFDKVANHFKNQKVASARIEEDGNRPCLYRKIEDDGTVLSCAAGCLIPDEEYSPSFEGLSIMNLIMTGRIPSLVGQDSVLLSALQKVHDAASREETQSLLTSETAVAMRKTAIDFGLSASVVDWA